MKIDQCLSHFALKVSRVGAGMTSCGREFQILVALMVGKFCLSLIFPLFLQSLIVTFGDTAVELDILCIPSTYSCCVFEQFYHVPCTLLY